MTELLDLFEEHKPTGSIYDYKDTPAFDKAYAEYKTYTTETGTEDFVNVTYDNSEY